MVALQRSEEWNRIRASAITASACSAVLDRSPWTSRKDYLEQKAYEKVFGRVEWPSNAAMEEGIFWEPEVIEMSKPFVLGFDQELFYADNSGAIINGVSTEYQVHPTIPFLGASPDKLILRRNIIGDGQDMSRLVSGLEVKKQFRMSKRGPEAWFPCYDQSYNYWCQCQLSMEVFDVETWHFFVVGQQVVSDDTLPDGSPAHVVAWSKHEMIHRDRQWFADSLPEFIRFMDELEELIEALKSGAEIPEYKSPEAVAAPAVEEEWDGHIEEEEWDGYID